MADPDARLVPRRTNPILHFVWTDTAEALDSVEQGNSAAAEG